VLTLWGETWGNLQVQLKPGVLLAQDEVLS
jgi:hypothetical protein